MNKQTQNSTPIRFDYTSGVAQLNTDRDGYFFEGSRRAKVYDILTKVGKLKVATLVERAAEELGDEVEAKAMLRQLHKLGFIRLGDNPFHNCTASHSTGFTARPVRKQRSK